MKKTFRELTLSEFEHFTKQCPSKNYMQSPDMFRRYQANHRESYLLGLLDGDKVVVAGIASVIFEKLGQKIFSFSRGPLSNDYNVDDFIVFLQECKKFLKSKHGLIVQISPNVLVPDAPADFNKVLVKHGLKDLGEYEQVKWIYTIDFSKIDNLPVVTKKHPKMPILNPDITEADAQTLFRTFRSGHRYTIRYATDRYGLTLRELPPEEYSILLKLMEESGKVHGFVPREQQFFEQLKEYFGSQVAAIVAETPEKIPVAVGFFILYGDEVIYLSSGFSREHKKLGGPHLIQWAMIKYAYANGYRKYNFWGTNPDPENGVYKFKHGFHGEMEEYVGTFAMPLSPVGKIYLQKLHYANHRDI